MFCTFTTERGTLILRTEDIRSLEDQEGGCEVSWLLHDRIYVHAVKGTARENLDRLKAEERAMVEEAQRVTRPPPPPTPLRSIDLATTKRPRPR